MNIKVGDKIHIYRMVDEPQYSGREGTVTYIDDIGNIHTTAGGLALVPDVDEFEIISKETN